MGKSFFESFGAVCLGVSLVLLLVVLFAIYGYALPSNPGGGGGPQTLGHKELNVDMVPPEVFDATSVYSMFTYQQEKKYNTNTEGTFSLESSQSRYKNEMSGTIETQRLEDLDNDEMYEAWLVDLDTGYQLSLGLFMVDSDGHAIFSYKRPNYVNPYDAVIVTKEQYPDDDPRPNGDVVLVGYFDTTYLTKSTVSTALITKEEYSKYGEEADTVY